MLRWGTSVPAVTRHQRLESLLGVHVHFTSCGVAAVWLPMPAAESATHSMIAGCCRAVQQQVLLYLASYTHAPLLRDLRGLRVCEQRMQRCEGARSPTKG